MASHFDSSQRLKKNLSKKEKTKKSDFRKKSEKLHLCILPEISFHQNTPISFEERKSNIFKMTHFSKLSGEANKT